VKNLLKDFKSAFEQTEERIHEHENKSIEVTQSEMKKSEVKEEE
jgi:hypothetical protein